MPSMSAVRISNMALSHIGAGTIEAMNEVSAEGQACNLWYDTARQQALKAYNWNFARKRQTLASHGDDPPEDVWSYRYQYPSDALTIREIENPLAPNTGLGAPTLFASRPQDIFSAGDAIPFEVEISDDGTLSILTNMEEAKAVYTFDQDDPTMFSIEFSHALSYLLAHHVAYVLTGKQSIRERMLQSYLNIVRAAGAINATESVAPPPREAEWVRGR